MCSKNLTPLSLYSNSVQFNNCLNHIEHPIYPTLQCNQICFYRTLFWPLWGKKMKSRFHIVTWSMKFFSDTLWKPDTPHSSATFVWVGGNGAEERTTTYFRQISSPRNFALGCGNCVSYLQNYAKILGFSQSWSIIALIIFTVIV